jgi:AcrR family transcriptional regulator
MDRVKTRTGGRSARVRERVFAAVREALESGDPGALAVERLATRAGVHKATIYRRWASTEGLVADLMTALTPVATPLPDSGDLRRDLAALVRRVSDTVAEPVALSTLRVVAGSGDAQLTAAAAEYWSQLLDHTAVVVRRAQQRGGATADVDAIDAIESLLGPIYLRLLVARRPIDRDFQQRLVDRTARMLA